MYRLFRSKNAMGHKLKVKLNKCNGGGHLDRESQKRGMLEGQGCSREISMEDR
jgi:hypothetical protein